MTFTKYKNPWYKPLQSMYGPEYYTVNSHERVGEYKGYFLVSKISQIDIVKLGEQGYECVTQRVTVRNAKAWIDSQYIL